MYRFSRTKPVTESLLGPQLLISHLALTTLQPPQCAETNTGKATLKSTALKVFGLTANKKQLKKLPKKREWNLLEENLQNPANHLPLLPIKPQKKNFICTISLSYTYTSTSAFTCASKKGEKTFMWRRNEWPRGSGQKCLQPAWLLEKTVKYPFHGQRC